MHIIVVDAHAIYRSAVADFLEYKLNAVVSPFSLAEAAVAAYNASGADLVITGHHMQGINGTELVCQLRARDATLPIILHSADARVEAIAEEAGATAFFLKPYSLSELCMTIRRLLAERQTAKVAA
jgi:DNA-binding NtrC family response regulator